MNEPEDLYSHNGRLLSKSSEGIQACTASLYINAYSPSSGRTQAALLRFYSRYSSLLLESLVNHLVCMQVDSTNGTGIN